MTLLRATADALLDVLAPARCAVCARPGQWLCDGCACAFAGLRQPGCGRVALGPGVLAAGAFAYDGAVRAAVLEMKTPGRHACAPALGTRMWAALDLDPDALRAAGVAVAWVPATRAGRRERGVEIPRLLAGPAAVPLLRRVAERPSQRGLGAARRRASPWGSFAARPCPAAVVLVDDVRTTGATLAAAAAALQAAGARRVLAVTLAVAGLSLPDAVGTAR